MISSTSLELPRLQQLLRPCREEGGRGEGRVRNSLPGDIVIAKKYRIVDNFSRISALKAAKNIFFFITPKFSRKKASILYSMLWCECLAPLGAQSSPTLHDCPLEKA